MKTFLHGIYLVVVLFQSLAVKSVSCPSPNTICSQIDSQRGKPLAKFAIKLETLFWIFEDFFAWNRMCVQSKLMQFSNCSIRVSKRRQWADKRFEAWIWNLILWVKSKQFYIYHDVWDIIRKSQHHFATVTQLPTPHSTKPKHDWKTTLLIDENLIFI